MHNSAYLLSIAVMKDKKYLYKQNLKMHSSPILAEDFEIFFFGGVEGMQALCLTNCACRLLDQFKVLFVQNLYICLSDSINILTGISTLYSESAETSVIRTSCFF